MRSSRDSLANLIDAAPAHVQAWMQRKAELADGHRVGLPVCGQLALNWALDRSIERCGEWMVADDQEMWRGVELARFGLLRGMCGLSWQEIANLTGGSVARAHRIGGAHRRLARANSGHAERAAEIGNNAMGRSLGG